MISEEMMIARAMNAAANGRAFCLALAAICLAVYLATSENMFVPLAVLAAFPIGLSYIIDAWQITGFMRGVAHAINLFIPVTVITILFTV